MYVILLEMILLILVYQSYKILEYTGCQNESIACNYFTDDTIFMCNIQS